jgi:hypothetical protein
MNSSGCFKLTALAFLCFSFFPGCWADTGKKVAPAGLSATSEPGCPGVGELVSVIGNKKIFSQTLEEFMQSTAGTLKLRDEKIIGEGASQSREVTFVEEKGSWLVVAQAMYDIKAGTNKFDRVRFKFSPSCFGAPDEFIRLSKKHFGKGFRDTSYAPPEKKLLWEFSDSDVNFVRLIEISASKERYELQIKIDPAPTEP